MSPKEQAILILGKYINLCYLELSPKDKLLFSKKCAMIAIDEICGAIYYHSDESTEKEWRYWQQVKKEIDKL
jgi:hypothetical protein